MEAPKFDCFNWNEGFREAVLSKDNVCYVKIIVKTDIMEFNNQ